MGERCRTNAPKAKIRLGGFVEKELHSEISRLADEEGMEFNKFGFVQKLVQEALAHRKRAAARKRKRRIATGNGARQSAGKAVSAK